MIDETTDEEIERQAEEFKQHWIEAQAMLMLDLRDGDREKFSYVCDLLKVNGRELINLAISESARRRREFLRNGLGDEGR